MEERNENIENRKVAIVVEKPKANFKASRAKVAVIMGLASSIISACGRGPENKPAIHIKKQDAIVSTLRRLESHMVDLDIFRDSVLGEYDAPKYVKPDNYEAIPPEPITLVDNNNQWVTIRAGSVNTAFLNRSSYPMSIDNARLTQWYAEFEITDSSRTAENPLFYIIEDDYHPKIAEQVQKTILKPEYAMAEKDLVPPCMTAFVTADVSLSVLSVNLIDELLKYRYEQNQKKEKRLTNSYPLRCKREGRSSFHQLRKIGQTWYEIILTTQ